MHKHNSQNVPNSVVWGSVSDPSRTTYQLKHKRLNHNLANSILKACYNRLQCVKTSDSSYILYTKKDCQEVAVNAENVSFCLWLRVLPLSETQSCYSLTLGAV